MARATAEEAYKGFIVTLYYQAGEFSGTSKATYDNMFTYANKSLLLPEDACKTIFGEIVNRVFDFEEVDLALKKLENKHFVAGVHVSGYRNSVYFNSYKTKVSAAAKYIAAFCAEQQLWWDDVNTVKSTFDMSRYKQTIIGSALWAAKCFLSQHVKTAKPAAKAKTPKASASGSGSSSSNAGGTYKSTGPQSQNARGLVGNPHDKVAAEGDSIYCIAGTKVTSNVPYVYVNPLKSRGDAGGNKNKVLEGAANDWTDCICYFDKPEDADKFLEKVAATLGWTQVKDPNSGEITYNSTKNTGFRVSKKKPHPNGYFIVDTDCGECAINAIKMNEELAEAAAAEAAKQPSGKISETEFNQPDFSRVKRSSIFDIDIYEEALKCD